jgi:hypothetical protein
VIVRDETGVLFSTDQGCAKRRGDRHASIISSGKACRSPSRAADQIQAGTKSHARAHQRREFCSMIAVSAPQAAMRSAEKCDELATFHSITSSARTSRDEGTVILRVFAVLRLTDKSILVGNSTGRSPGRAPCRILSTKEADRRQHHSRSTP